MITKNIHKQVKSIYKYVQSCCKKRNNPNPRFNHIVGDHYIEQADFIGFSFVDQCLGISRGSLFQISVYYSETSDVPTGYYFQVRYRGVAPFDNQEEFISQMMLAFLNKQLTLTADVLIGNYDNVSVFQYSNPNFEAFEKRVKQLCK